MRNDFIIRLQIHVIQNNNNWFEPLTDCMQKSSIHVILARGKLRPKYAHRFIPQHFVVLVQASHVVRW